MKQLRKKPKPIKSITIPLEDNSRFHPELKKYLGYCLYKSAVTLRGKVDKQLGKYGLIAPQCGILALLQVEGDITQVELSTYMAIDKATMVRMIDSLEEKKLVTRVQSKTDRRANYLHITKQGIEALGKIQTERKKAEDEFLAPLEPGERAQLLALIGKLVANI